MVAGGVCATSNLLGNVNGMFRNTTRLPADDTAEDLASDPSDARGGLPFALEGERRVSVRDKRSHGLDLIARKPLRRRLSHAVADRKQRDSGIVVG